jgi:hypothetical protein
LQYKPAKLRFLGKVLDCSYRLRQNEGGAGILPASLADWQSALREPDLHKTDSEHVSL